MFPGHFLQKAACSLKFTKNDGGKRQTVPAAALQLQERSHSPTSTRRETVNETGNTRGLSLYPGAHHMKAGELRIYFFHEPPFER